MTLQELIEEAHESISALLNKMEEAEDHEKNDPRVLALVNAENVLRQMVRELGQESESE